MFNKLKKILVLLIIFIFICSGFTGFAFIYGRFLSKTYEVKTSEVNSTVILDRIQNNYFVVTKTVFTFENTKIEIRENSNWNNLLWGHTINAQATMRTDVGVDMNKLNEGDIKIDNLNKKVIINLPKAEILDTSLFGEMQIDTQSGILKQLFENDKSADFNLAQEQLKDKAIEAINSKPELFEEAQTSSVNLIKLIINDLGYQVEIL